jgi:hypothetical protein
VQTALQDPVRESGRSRMRWVSSNSALQLL